jgi:Icc-related predicted phosphoesterase
MKILLTADLHYRLTWFQWLIDQAPMYDLVCIAGDFLDIFNGEPRENQARVASVLVRELGRVTRVAVCSGNHDISGRQVTMDRAPIYQWFVWLADNPKIITDGVTRLVENLVVTTVPYHSSRADKSIWLDRGRSIRKQRGGQWLILHHVPPNIGPKVSGEEREAAEIFAEYQPDYFLGGHIHQLPYLGVNSAVQRIGQSTLLVPGQLLNAPVPNHIVLDTETGEAGWQTASREWIPETLNDRFVLKFE